MKLEIARGLFLVGALGVASLAAAAWHEPEFAVVDGSEGLSHCPAPLKARAKLHNQLQPDQDLLLLMFGLSQGLRSRG